MWRLAEIHRHPVFSTTRACAYSRLLQNIKQLTEVLDLHTVPDVLALVGHAFPEEEPPARLALLLEDIFGQDS
jgi:hypothetical protein